MAKNKMKSHRGASKRFKLTGSGKVKRNKAYKSHILTKKSPKRRLLRTEEQGVQSREPGCHESAAFCVCRKKEQEKRIQKTVDRENQRGRENERNFLQQTDGWTEEIRN